MKNSLFRILLFFSCSIAAGSITILIYFPELEKTQKICSILLIIGMILVSSGLILSEKRRKNLTEKEI